MPSTATITTFYYFTSGTIYTTEVNNNFDVFRGTLCPVDPSVGSLANLSYDLGSSDHSWRYLYSQGMITKGLAANTIPASGFYNLYPKTDGLWYTMNESGTETSFLIAGATQTATNKTFDDAVTMKEVATPSNPSSGYQKVFMDTSDNKMKRLDSSGNVFAIGGGAGDADTIHLYKAADQGTTDWTILSVGLTNEVLPNFAGSSTLAASFTVPTTGSEALLSNDNAHKVYKWASASNSQYDAQGLTLSIPKYARGSDLVLQFKYRTADTSGASSNGDYMVWVWDATNGVQATAVSTGAQSAGTSIEISSSTGMAVGDKIWIGETGSTVQVTESHITAIADGTHVTLADAVNLSSGDRFTTGVLTDVLTTLDAADDDTDLTGTDFKVVFLPPSDCASVVVMFQQLTSQTDSFLYFDNILLSSELVKKVSAKKNGAYFTVKADISKITNGAAEIEYNTDTVSDSIIQGNRDLFYISDDSGNTRTKFIAYKRIKVSINATHIITAANTTLDIWKNGVVVSYGTSAYDVNRRSHASWSGTLEKDDYLTIACTGAGAALATSGDNFTVAMVAEPMENSVVLVESTDSVVGPWENLGATQISATTTAPTKGTMTTDAVWARRNGDSMEFRIEFEQTGAGAAGSGDYLFGLNGYYIDTDKFTTITGTANNLRGPIVGNGRVASTTGTYTNYSADATVHVYSNTYVRVVLDIGQQGAYWGSGNRALSDAACYGYLYFTVPIAGYDANPKPVLAFPTVTYGQEPEAATYHTRGDADGRASTNTAIAYFATEVSNSISNLGTISNSATNGWSFTASRRVEIVAKWDTAYSGAAGWFGFSKNSNQLTTSIESITDAHRMSATYSDASGNVYTTVATGILDPGDVLRAHSNGSGTFVSTAVGFNLTIVVKPIQGVTNQAAIISQPVVYLSHEDTAAGGNSTANTEQTRTLNKIRGDIAAVGVSLSSNQFTLPAGKYCIEGWSIAYDCGQHQCYLKNVTDTTYPEQFHGSAAGMEQSSGNDSTETRFEGHITLTSSKTFSLMHWTQLSSTGGLGNRTDNGTNNNATTSVYAKVKITRLK